MTDFTPESQLSGYPSLVPQGMWTDAQEPTPARPASAPQQSAASLAAAAQHLLDSMVRKRVPRVDALRRQLQLATAGPSLEHVDAALADLHDAIAALDFIAGRNGGDRALEFLQQCAAIHRAGKSLQDLAGRLTEHHATQAPVSRLLWIELVLESASLQKRVRQGAHWLAQMDRELHKRRQSATAEVSHRALEELGRRGRTLRERLQTVHRLCGLARSVHAACEQLAQQRAVLGTTLQVKVPAAGDRLHDALQPLIEALAYRPLVPEELVAAIDTRHAMQVTLTQARAEVALLQSGVQDLAVQLAGIEQKAQHLS
ncbi:hypothetical protein [Ramlibacter pallidus]|uniref:Toxic anion resistance protein n=1 Tax=Ramlibacter pallidus TaxID=2780087 RepID=A0ABR9S789_9BURK|nr:hypothetical protein [Ramlibacter pallidus]MBE7369373.1 hypothetical protein [Ramlibacter pallidus]